MGFTIYLSCCQTVEVITGAIPPQARSKEIMDAVAPSRLAMDASGATTQDVGATIARKKSKKLTSSALHSAGPSKKKSSSSSSSSSQQQQPTSSSSSSHVRRPVSMKKSKGSSWDVFVEGTTLYVLCLAAPTLLGIVVRWYEGWAHLQQLQLLAHRTAFGSGLNSHRHHHDNILLSYAMHFYSSTWSYVCDSFSLTSDWCLPAGESSSSSSPSLEAGTRKLVASLQAQDAHLSDLAIVIILSLSMALIRILLVHFLVPRYLTSPQRLEALVRCKSIHLLSAAYPPSLTPNHHSQGRAVAILPSETVRPDQLQHVLLQGPPPFLPDLQNPVPTANELFALRPSHDVPRSATTTTMEHESLSQQPTAQPSSSNRFRQGLSSLTHSLILSMNRSSRRALGRELSTLYDSEEMEDGDRLFSAPRYATAVFRTIYCLASCIIALLFFQQANFWPTYLGGHGQTAKCWDLSGGTTLSFDSDFDQRNAVLRRYFIVQASYHLHSGAFHVLSMIILGWWKYQQRSTQPESVPTTTTASASAQLRQPHVISVRSSMKAYGRSLMQHVVALALIGGAYLFSSLRRLGAIAMFAFDLSSLSLHFLQICMNAPDASPLRNPDWILWVHRALVIPVFLYTRFFVWPFLVWYSAVVESKHWLQQLENTLVPHSAKYMRWMFHALLLYVISLNLVYFRRLLFHPHLKRILQDKRSSSTKMHAPAESSDPTVSSSKTLVTEDDWEPLTDSASDLEPNTTSKDWRHPYDQAIFVDRRGESLGSVVSNSSKTLLHRNIYHPRQRGGGDMDTIDTDESDSVFPMPSSTGEEEEDYVHVQRLSATPPRRR